MLSNMSQKSPNNKKKENLTIKGISRDTNARRINNNITITCFVHYISNIYQMTIANDILNTVHIEKTLLSVIFLWSILPSLFVSPMCLLQDSLHDDLLLKDTSNNFHYKTSIYRNIVFIRSHMWYKVAGFLLFELSAYFRQLLTILLTWLVNH